MPARIEKSWKLPSSWMRASGSISRVMRQEQQRLGPRLQIGIASMLSTSGSTLVSPRCAQDRQRFAADFRRRMAEQEAHGRMDHLIVLRLEQAQRVENLFGRAAQLVGEDVRGRSIEHGRRCTLGVEPVLMDALADHLDITRGAARWRSPIQMRDQHQIEGGDTAKLKTDARQREEQTG